MRRILLPLAALLLLGACSSDKDTTITGERVPVLKTDSALKPDESLADQPLVLPESTVNDSWPQVMGLADGSLGNIAFTRVPERAWSASVGEGSDDEAKLLSRPISADGKVFTLDSNAEVRAFALQDGDRLWSRSLVPDDYDEEQFGGGVAYGDGRVFVTTAYGTIAALKAKNGDVVWQQQVRDVLRTAPVYAGGRVFFISSDGKTHALDATDGHELWVHTGISEASTLLGNATPVVADDVVFTPYSSGELYAVRVQNGKTLWQQSLAGSRSGGGMPALSDIKGSPALDNERVYAVSNAGRMAAVDKRTGNAVWDIDLVSIDTPVIAGETIFVLAERNKLVLVDRKSGRLCASYELPKFEDEQNSKKPIYWSGPVVADGVAWVVSSKSKLIGIDAVSGKQVLRDSISDSTYLAPIVVDKTMLILTDDGRLTAYR